MMRENIDRVNMVMLKEYLFLFILKLSGRGCGSGVFVFFGWKFIAKRVAIVLYY